LSGEHIVPHESDIAEKNDVQVDRATLRWCLSGSRVDERALLSLVNLLHFAHVRNPIALVEVEASRSEQLQKLEVRKQSTYYPGLFPPPFELRVDEPIGSSVSIAIRPKRPLHGDDIAEFEDTFLMWTVAPSVGAFAVEDVPITANGMEPLLTVEMIDDELRWGIDRFRMHPAALDSFVNCCTALSSRVAPIASLEIS